MKRKAVIFLCALLCLSLLAGCGGGKATETAAPTTSAQVEATPATSGTDFSTPVKIVFSSSSKAGSTSALMYESWMKAVTEKSGGAITFDYKSDAALGSETESFQQICDGIVQAGVAGIATYTSYSKLLESYQLPFLINSYDLEHKAIQTPEFQALLEGTAEDIGSVYIYGTVDVGMRHFGMINKPINTIADIKGVKVRTASSELLIEALQTVGANPVAIGYTEVYSALQNKIVDGEDVNYATAFSQKHYEIIKYFSEIGMYPYPSFICFNKDFIDSLPAGYWDLMKECMDEAMETYFTKTIVDADAQLRAEMEKNGVTVNEVSDIEEWEKALDPMYAEYTTDADQRVIDFVNAVKALKGTN